MGGRRNTGVVEQPKPVRLSDWIKQPGRPVTRAECVNVVAHLMERRLMVERELQRQRKWRVRFWMWLTQFFTGQREPTAAEIDRATTAALDPSATSTEPEPEEEDGAEEGGIPHPEVPLEVVGDGVKYRDKRKRPSESPVTDAEGAE
jgi:hypothetical protein